MVRSHLVVPPLLVALSLITPCALAAGPSGDVEDNAENKLDEIGETRVARWRGNADAAFMLFFDDGWPSHWQEAIPALRARGLTGSFYPNYAKGEFKKFRKRWDVIVAEGDMTFGNHTMTHRGITSPEDARYEIGEATRETRAMMPDRDPKMISFAKPGGLPKDRWQLTDDERATLFEEFALVQRPTFTGHGSFYHLKTVEDHTALVDLALKTGDAEYITFHGIKRGPDYPWSYEDFWPLPLEVFHPVLDYIADKRDKGQLWVTDHISSLQYAKERDVAKVRGEAVSKNELRVDLVVELEPTRYDHPLTLITRVPAGWSACRVEQAGESQRVSVTDEEIMYDVKPHGGAILIRVEPVD